MQKKTNLTLLVILLTICILSVSVIADATVSVTPGALPKTDATFVVTYAGTVSAITVVTPDGRSLTGASDGAGSASVYLGEAPSGTYRLTLTGDFSTFSVSISGTAAATATAAPTPTPIPAVETIPQPTQIPTPIPTPTPTPEPTPIPTPTPISLQIVTPTPTPKPTPTPEPTPTPTPTSSLPATTTFNKETIPSNSNPEAGMASNGVAEGVTVTSTPTPTTTQMPTKEIEKDGQTFIPGLTATVGQTKEIGIILYMVSAVFGTLLGFAGGYIIRDRKIKRDRQYEAYGQEIQFDDNGRQII